MRIENVSLKINPLDISEVKRYMRAGKDESEELDLLVREQTDKIYTASTPRACYAKLPVEICGDTLKIGDLEMRSQSLSKRLDGCYFAYIFAATVGSEVDRLIRAGSVKSGVLGLIADASGSAAVEEACDELCRMLSASEKAVECLTVSRFSCGYGDLSIEYQKDILDMLNAKKNIGVTLTLGGMMTPTKTVTAIVGVKREDSK